MTGYSSGMLRDRVTLLARLQDEPGIFGLGSAGEYVAPVGKAWASVSFTKGIRPMREGLMEAYDDIMVRMEWRRWIVRDMMLMLRDGRVFQIVSFNADRQDKVIQITATETKISKENIMEVRHRIYDTGNVVVLRTPFKTPQPFTLRIGQQGKEQYYPSTALQTLPDGRLGMLLDTGSEPGWLYAIAQGADPVRLGYIRPADMPMVLVIVNGAEAQGWGLAPMARGDVPDGRLVLTETTAAPLTTTDGKRLLVRA